MYFYKLLVNKYRFMKEKESALYSQYIIDGTRCDATPAELLEECLEFPEGTDEDSTEFDDIIDESTEPTRSLQTGLSVSFILSILQECRSLKPF